MCDSAGGHAHSRTRRSGFLGRRAHFPVPRMHLPVERRVRVGAAGRSYSWIDRASVGLGAVVGNAPPFWLGLVLVFVFAVLLGVFPSEGMHDLRSPGGLIDLLRHLALPALTTAAAPGAIILRQVRASVIETRQQDFVKVAYAKGLLRRVVFWRHIFRAALPPVITIAGLQLGYLMGG